MLGRLRPADSRAVRPARRLAIAGASLFLLCAFLFDHHASSQSQQPPERQPQPTFRVSDLATIDAIVTDKQGQHVRDLRPEDFEVRQRGRLLAVRQVVYIETSTPAPAVAAVTQFSTEVTVPPTQVVAPVARAGPPHDASQKSPRTIAVVVDDSACRSSPRTGCVTHSAASWTHRSSLTVSWRSSARRVVSVHCSS